MLAAAGYININGKVWLPNLKCVRDCLKEFQDELNPYFLQSLVPWEEASTHPLFHATEMVEEELLKCPDKLNNVNQLMPILEQSNDVFVCLTYDPVTASLKNEITSEKAKVGIKRRRLHEQDFSQ